MNIEALCHELLNFRETSTRLLQTGDIEGWLNSLAPELRAGERLRSYLLDNPIIVTEDPDVKRLVAEMDLTEIDDPDKVGSELLFSWISPAEYGAAIAEVSVLIAPFRIPPDLETFLGEARQCYALRQYSAVQSLSRTILEAAVSDIAVRTGKIPKEAIEHAMFREYPPYKRIKLVAGPRFEQVYEHYKDLCKVVHGLATTASLGALGSLTKTIGFVQHLYEQHKGDICGSYKTEAEQ